MKIRFVVVDDAAFLRELVKNILKDMGALCVGEAADGNEAITVVQNSLPDLVILDMVMPQENGIELARRIREVSHEVVIVACSTLDDQNIMDNAKDVGCNEYLVKPFTKEGLLKVIGKHFKFEAEKSK